MSPTGTKVWAEANKRYLAAALAWLRLRLAQREHGPVVPPPVQHNEPEQRQGFLRRPAEQHPTPSAQSAPRAGTVDEQIAQKYAEMLAAEAQDETPALILLAQRLDLSPFERHILLLCVAMELDVHIAEMCARAQNNENRPYPTFALAMELFDDPIWEALSPERPLRYWRLLEINQPNDRPLTTSALRADERIVNYVQGLDYLDDRLVSLLVPLDLDGQQILPTSQALLVKTILQQWQRASLVLPLVQLIGPDALSKQLIASYTASTLGRHLYRLPIEMLPQQPTELETLARLWHRESLLMPLALYIDAQESDGNSPLEGHTLSLNRFLARSEGIFFLGTREPWLNMGRVNFSLDVERPTPKEQQAAWAAILSENTDLPDEDDAAADKDAKDADTDTVESVSARLAGQFNLNLTTIYQIAQTVLVSDDNEQDAEEDDETKSKKSKKGKKDRKSEPSIGNRLWDACRMSMRPRLDMLAQRLDLKAHWDDLILPDEETRMLHQLADQVGLRSKVYEDWGFAARMNRGLGISALFVGEPGTGKTLAAEVLANELRMSLYRIDLSAVVSKYIGETEKNLRRVFDAAEDGGAMLFFDEADALFGKRSEVKDARDHYVNIEINYLLQRIEAYRGLAILATNMKSSIDPAFMRRLRFIITFPFPDSKERKRMWKRVFPQQTPTQGLDNDLLARLNLTGGSIQNIAINAAFMAAQAKGPVTLELVMLAARDEFRKLERRVNEQDFKLPKAQAAQATKGAQT